MTKRPNVRGEQMILNMVAKDELRRTYIDYVAEHNFHKTNGYNILNSELKMLNKCIQREINNKRRVFNIGLEMRRERLRNLLMKEGEQYNSEIMSWNELHEEDLLRLESEHQEMLQLQSEAKHEYSKKQYDRMWEDRCDELRDIETRQKAKQVHEDNIRQLELKSENGKRKKVEEDFFIELNSCNAQQEIEKANEKAKNRRLACEDLAKFHLEQMQTKSSELGAALDKEKKDEKEQLEKHLNDLEEEKKRDQLEKQNKKAATRKTYDEQVHLRNLSKEADRITEQAFDDKFIEQVKNDLKAENSGRLNFKDHLYKDYVEQVRMKNLKDEALRKEEEWHNNIIKQYNREYNDKILADMRYRYGKQKDNAEKCKEYILTMIEDKKKEAAEAKRQDELAVDAYKARMEELKLKEKEYYEEVRSRHKDFEKELKCQITYNSHMKCLAKKEKERERLAMQEAEKDYKRRIQVALNTRKTNLPHPMRKYLANTKQEFCQNQT